MLSGKSLAQIRRLHLYLGCVFAPMLILFALSGAWQTYGLHRSTKNPEVHPDPYEAPRLVQVLSAVHMHQKLVVMKGAPLPQALRIFVLAMSIGLILTTLLGIVMAFKFMPNSWIVWLCLAVGAVLPAWFLITTLE